MAKRRHNISLIPGDGIGPEVIREGVKVLEKVSRKLRLPLGFADYAVGAARYLKTQETLTEKELDAIGASDAVFLGAVGDPKVPPGI